MKLVVIFTPCGPLCLDHVKYDESGRVKTGRVVNGAWDFEIRGSEQLAKSGNFIVNRWPDAPSPEIKVPSSVGEDYDAVIAWAEQERKRS